MQCKLVQLIGFLVSCLDGLDRLDGILFTILVVVVQVKSGFNIVLGEEEFHQFAFAVSEWSSTDFFSVLKQDYRRQLTTQRAIRHMILLPDLRQPSNINFSKLQVIQFVFVRELREDGREIHASWIPSGVECHQPHDALITLELLVKAVRRSKVHDTLRSGVGWLGQQQSAEHENHAISDAKFDVRVEP